MAEQLTLLRSFARVIAYGGGLDSYEVLLGCLEAGEHLDAVCFVDVADPDHEDPGEWPSTYRHLREVVRPLCERHDVPFVWLSSDRYPVRDSRSLFAWLRDRHQIPVAGPQRICTTIAKVERFEQWLGNTFPGYEVEVLVGFEAGEEKRAANDPNTGGRRSGPLPGGAVRRNRFPLMERGLCRCRCEAAVRARGLAVPRKSACVYCPYGSKGDWQTFARELPAWFALTEKLESDKPLTKNGRKLSIMGYRTIKKNGAIVAVKAPPLREFIRGTYRPLKKICPVCGGPRATKATGCDYLAAA